MPATHGEKQFLHGLARRLAEGHPDFSDPRGARRAEILVRGVFSQFWFNWRPIGVTMKALEKLRQGATKGFRRHHINDRNGWTHRLLSPEWLQLGADGWFAEYAMRDRTMVGLPGEMTTLRDKLAVQWVELTDPALFHNHSSGFSILQPELAWSRDPRRHAATSTGVGEFIVQD